jgi:hypothetical protein
MKVEDPKKRKRLAAQVARGELTLIKLRDKIEGRPARSAPGPDEADGGAGLGDAGVGAVGDETSEEAAAAWTGRRKDIAAENLRDDSLVSAKQQLADAVETLMDVLRAPDVVRGIGSIDRANLAKYLTIAKLRLENAIAVVRSENG